MLAKFLDDQNVSAERLKELRKEVDDSEKTLKRLKQDNDELKKKVGDLKALRKKKRWMTGSTFTVNGRMRRKLSHQHAHTKKYEIVARN